MAYATEKYQLPTGGILAGVPATVTLRNMTTAEEKILLGSSEDAFDDILQACVMDEGFKLEDCTVADKYFLLVKLRIISYGPDYFYSYRCPYCGKIHEYHTDLDELPVETLPADFSEPFDTFPLPMCGDEIALRIPRIKDVNSNKMKVKRYNKKFPEAKGDVSLIYGMMSSIQSVNGKPIPGSEFLRYVEGLPAGDSAFIRNRITRLKFGLDTTLYETCKNSHCGEDLEIRLRMNSEFFHTRNGQ